MIQELKIRNFLSHKKTNLKFSPGVNIIVGDTDAGKSAIIRSLRWLVFNRPNGEKYRSNWGGDTSVKAIMDDYEVTRIKGTGNSYMLSDHSEGGRDHLVFNAIKTDVPEEVSQVLNLADLNIQNQLDSHFLISKSPGEVAYHFNTIAHLNKIDIGLSNVLKWIRTIEAVKNAKQAEIESLEEQLEDYKDINIIEEKVELLESLNEREKKVFESIKRLKEVIYSLTDTDEEISNVSEILIAEDTFIKVVSIRKEYDKLEGACWDLNETIYEIRKIDKEIKEYSNLIEALPVVNNLVELDKKVLYKMGEVTELEDSIKYIQGVETELEMINADLYDLEKEWHNNIGDVCPICGNKIK